MLLTGPLLITLSFSQTARSAAIKKLEDDRYKIFHAVIDRPNSGWFGGAEGADHEIYFPIGRADTMYLVCFGPGDPLSKSKCQVTRWSGTDGHFKKVWQLNLVVGKESPPPTGTLHGLAVHYVESLQPYHKLGTKWVAGPEETLEGFHVNKKSREWTKAAGEMDAVRNLVDYHYGMHGDVSFQGYVTVIDPSGKEVNKNEIDHMGAMKVPPEEITLMSKP